MAAQRFHRPPGRHRPNKVGTAPPVQVDQLDARGPIHPDTESARWPIHDPFDAVDALDLSRPEGFESGVLVLFLDENREPTVVLAVHNAPADELDRIVTVIGEATSASDGNPLRSTPAVILGIVRKLGAGADLTQSTPSPPSARAKELEDQNWRLAGQVLAGLGVDLVDVLALDDSCWSSMALRCRELFYPAESDCRLRWYEAERCGED